MLLYVLCWTIQARDRDKTIFKTRITKHLLGPLDDIQMEYLQHNNCTKKNIKALYFVFSKLKKVINFFVLTFLNLRLMTKIIVFA